MNHERVLLLFSILGKLDDEDEFAVPQVDYLIYTFYDTTARVVDGKTHL